LFKYFLSFLLALCITPTLSAAVPKVPDSPYGMNNWDWTEADVRELKAARVNWARVMVDWSKIQPEAGGYDWSTSDAALEALERGGLRALFTIYGPPAWSKGKDTDLPEPKKFGAFVKAAAERYKGRVSAYEMLNEENTGIWPRVSDRRASVYVPILKAGYKAVKAADPGAKVLMAGMWQFPVHYLEDMYRAGAKGSFDAINVHYYLNAIEGGPRFFDSIRGDFPFLLHYLKSVTKKYKDDKPIWITEIGWAISKENQSHVVSEDQQAEYLTYAYDQAMKSGVVEKIFWYVFYWGDAMALIHKGDRSAQFGPSAGPDYRRKAYAAHNAFVSAHPAWKKSDMQPWTPPPPAEKPARITNPGFEDGMSGWQALRNAKVEVDTSAAHTGKASIKVTTVRGEAARAAQGGIPIEGGRFYEVKGWIRMTGGAKEMNYARAMVEVQAWGEGGKSLNVTGPLHDRRAGEQLSTNYYISETEGKWYEVHYPFYAPAEAKTVNIGLRLDFGPGEAWFDDISIVPLNLTR
jgi:polysaccharide biosynthesis protein PslG